MTGLEIALLVLGIAFVVISFFIVGEKKESEAEGPDGQVQPRKLTEEEEAQIRERVAELTAEIIEETVSDTDAKLDRLSNEKIISLSELSDQVLAKIESNHKEAVFLYDMLQKKEEEIKEQSSKADDSRREFESIYTRIRAVVDEEAALIAAIPEKTPKATVRKASPAKAAPKEGTAKAKEPAVRKASAKPVKAEPKTEESDYAFDLTALVGTSESADADLVSKNDKILALHKKKKSVMEISKLLGIGQGEVKLVIDLYSGK